MYFDQRRHRTINYQRIISLPLRETIYTISLLVTYAVHGDSSFGNRDASMSHGGIIRVNKKEVKLLPFEYEPD